MPELQDKMLAMLGDSCFHSDVSLARRLGVSLQEIATQYQRLESLGLSLEFEKGRGYRLPGNVELLSNEIIRHHLEGADDPQLSLCDLQIFRTIDSTNRYAREQAGATDLTGSVILSESQSAGRGRLGKVWESPFAANIYMSVIWRFETGANALQGLSLGVGVAVRRSLLDLGVVGIQLKWPNDIYCDGKKLGGILLEMIGDPSGECTVIIGLGLNVSMPVIAAQEINQPWTDLQTVAPFAVSRNVLVASLIKSLFKVLGDFPECGFAGYRDEWQFADLLKGSQGTVSNPSGSISGTILGVDSVGALRMQLASGEEQRFIGGELSLRGNL